MIALDETQLLNQFGDRRTKFEGVTGEVVSESGDESVDLVISEYLSPHN